MKGLIAIAAFVIMLSVLFTSPVTATDYDPRRPPWRLELQDRIVDSGDDDPLGVDKLGVPRFALSVPLGVGDFVLSIIRVLGIDKHYDNGCTKAITEDQAASQGF